MSERAIKGKSQKDKSPHIVDLHAKAHTFQRGTKLKDHIRFIGALLEDNGDVELIQLSNHRAMLMSWLVKIGWTS